MAVGPKTTFVTGADGFVGMQLVRLLAARGHQVSGLAGTIEAAERLRRVGATAVIGDLRVPGRWQDEAAADWVFHLPRCLPHESPADRKRAASVADVRVAMDAHLLDAVSAGATRRIVYATDTSGYVGAGPRPITEDEPTRPTNQGLSTTPALDRVDGYVVAGLPIVTALLGWVYGNGSWLRERVVDPILAGRRLLEFETATRWVSPIHVHDCARALVHLAEHGAVGGRYFVVGRDAAGIQDFARTFACLADRPLRAWRVPAIATRLAIGALRPDYPRADGVFSSARLRGIGFPFLYPTLEQGLRQVLETLHE